MQIESFRIKNFKGITDTKLNIDGGDPCRIITLIGLNESGKTTILEALSNFVGGDEDLSTLTGLERPQGYTREFVPKNKKANFTGAIELEATLKLEPEDKEALAEFFKEKYGSVLDVQALSDKMVVNRKHSFENSDPKGSQNFWNVNFTIRRKGQKQFRSHNNNASDLWLAGVAFLGERFPRICYFPTLLFNVPDRIYLEEIEDEGASAYYREILQDILDVQGEGLNLEDHVIARIARERDAGGNPMQLFAKLWGLDSREQIDAVFSKMSSVLSREVFGAWHSIFKRQPRNKHLAIEWGIDSDKGNAAYAQIQIVDGESRYALSERSLGFRWFFCFLLFTRFRASKKGERRTYFLFDEPASNLHAKAQLQLLASFPLIAGERNLIMYSTHSHYMIEPRWLDRAYIVVNKAIDYDDAEESLDYFSTKPTQITAEGYRNFVAQHPERTTYFQPVLDRLDYVASPLVGSRDCLIVEGKQDFYAIKSILADAQFDILPGTGAGNFETLVSLFLGWGRKFLILLDDDVAGRKQRDRYIEEYLLKETQVGTWADVSGEFKGKRLEGLFSADLAKSVAQGLKLPGSAGKRDFALYFQERLAKQASGLAVANIDNLTRENFEKVATFVGQRFSLKS